jgi:uncharacterized Zn finger protein
MYWGEYVSVGERRAIAKKAMDKLRKKGKKIYPIEISGRIIARSFWGKGWCEHLESFSDYDNRLPRGRTYARNGSVCHLDIQSGKVEAIVSGSSLYKVSVKIKKLGKSKWNSIKKKCTGQISSFFELLQGKISDKVMKTVTDEESGLFPLEKEIEYSCDCPDWADMCKHVAAVMYGIGNRLDNSPELLFLLRDVDPEELIASEIDLGAAIPEDTGIAEDDLAALFDIEMEEAETSDTTPQGFTGADIRHMRESQKLTVAEFARKLGVTQASIFRWEASEKILNLRESSYQALLRFRS